MRRPHEEISAAERRELVREGEAFARTLALASYYAEDLDPWIERAKADIEHAHQRAASSAFARRELVYKPVLLERLRAIRTARQAGGKSRDREERR